MTAGSNEFTRCRKYMFTAILVVAMSGPAALSALGQCPSGTTHCIGITINNGALVMADSGGPSGKTVQVYPANSGHSDYVAWAFTAPSNSPSPSVSGDTWDIFISFAPCLNSTQAQPTYPFSTMVFEVSTASTAATPAYPVTERNDDTCKYTVIAYDQKNPAMITFDPSIIVGGGHSEKCKKFTLLFSCLGLCLGGGAGWIGYSIKLKNMRSRGSKAS